ncbi:MAG: hypothetical protein AAGB11_16710 [Pseudomonadota bacterium]
MVRMALAALLLLAGVGAADAATTRINNPDGTVVDVVTTQTGSVVTSYDSSGNRTDKLRYPTYSGDDGHERLLLMLSPPGAKLERQK